MATPEREATPPADPSWPKIEGYTCEAELGRGGMGVVYRVREAGTDKLLALKMVRTAQDISFEEFVRFRVEAEALSCLDHQNIVKIKSVGLYQGAPYFLMPLADGGTLKQAIAKGVRSPMWSIKIVHDVAIAMQQAHERGMLHRDLKPANVLLHRNDVPMVTDFGLVKFLKSRKEVADLHSTTVTDLLGLAMTTLYNADEKNKKQRRFTVSDAAMESIVNEEWMSCAGRTGVLRDPSKLLAVQEFAAQVAESTPQIDAQTMHGVVMGTPNYMAPEQARGDLDQVGPGTDVYGIGGILYELLTGYPPFRSQDRRQLLHDVCNTRPVPPRNFVTNLIRDIEAVCLKCLEKNPESRYKSAGALVLDLRQLIAGYEPIEAKTPQSESSSEVDFGPLASASFDTTPVALPNPAEAETPTRSWWPFGRKKNF